jgi:hypothetical protein
MTSEPPAPSTMTDAVSEVLDALLPSGRKLTVEDEWRR